MSDVDNNTLDWLKVGATKRVSPEFAQTLNAQIMPNPVWDGLLYTLTAKVLAEQLPPSQVTETKRFDFDVPASPWQAYKNTHADRWWMRRLVRRRPVRMITYTRDVTLTVDLDRYCLYPQAKVLPDTYGRPVRVADVSSRWTVQTR